MSLIVKGESVSLDLVGGSTLTLPRGYGFVHDPTGRVFDRCTVFVGPVKRTRRAVGHSPDTRRYFGTDYRIREALVRIPSAATFSRVGEVEEIRYVRRGRDAGAYYHPFRASHPRLAKSGRWYRIELGKVCVIDDRGFVFP